MERFPELSEFSQVQEPGFDECYTFENGIGSIHLFKKDGIWAWSGSGGYAAYSIVDYESMQEAYEDAKFIYEANNDIIPANELDARQDELFARYPHMKEMYEIEFGPVSDWPPFMAGYEAGRKYAKRAKKAMKKKAVTYYQTDARNMVGEEDVYDFIVGGMLAFISGDYGEISLEEARDDNIAYFTDLCQRAYDDIKSGEAKSIYEQWQ